MRLQMPQIRRARRTEILGGTITACYATGNVTSTSTNEFSRGGLVGRSSGTDHGLLLDRQGDELRHRKQGRPRRRASWHRSRTATSTTSSAASSTTPALTLMATSLTTLTRRRPPSCSRPQPTMTTQMTRTTAASTRTGTSTSTTESNPGLEDGSAAGDAGTDSPWDFGTDSEYPALSIDFDGDGVASAYEFGEQERPRPRLPNTLNLSLIDVGSFEQLNAIRYDLDGNAYGR